MLAVTAHSFDCCKLRVFCSWYVSSNPVSFFFSQGISCILEIFSLCIPPTSSSLCMNVLTFVQRPSPWSFIKKRLPQCFVFFVCKMWGKKQQKKTKMKQCLDICTVRTIFLLIVTVQRTQVISLNVSHSDGQKQSCMFWQKHKDNFLIYLLLCFLFLNFRVHFKSDFIFILYLI